MSMDSNDSLELKLAKLAPSSDTIDFTRILAMVIIVAVL